MRLFKNRQEAAHELAGALDYVRSDKPVVLGLANGGVPLAEIIADELDAQFDVMLLDRLHAPAAPEHVVGAVDEHGRISMIQSTARWHHLTSQQMVEPAREAFRGLQRKRGKVRAILPELDVRDRTVIVVSQGVASGAKLLGAIASLRDRGANRIVAAAPAGTEKASWQLHESADVVVIPHRPTQFKGIEHFYEDFQHVSDEELIATIERRIAARPEQHVLLRHAHVVELDRVQAVLVIDRNNRVDLDTFGFHINQNEGNPFLFLTFVTGADQDKNPISILRVGRPDLCTVDHIVIPIQLCLCFQSSQIGTSARL